jgi:plasmid stabilization system protein ParE
VSGRYVLRPKAEQDLDDQAYYLAMEARSVTNSSLLRMRHSLFSLLDLKWVGASA